MSKYSPLQDFLHNLPATDDEKTISFDAIEQIIHAKLPASALVDRAWWANASFVDDHPYAQAWLGAGWHVETVSHSEKWVRFRRI